MIVTDVINMVFYLIIIYAVLIAAMLYRKGQRQKKRSVSLDYIKRWNEHGYQRIFTDLFTDTSNRNMDIRDILYEKASSESSIETLKEIEKVWNFFEELAIAIIFKEADEEVLKEFFFYSLVATYKLSEKAFYGLRERHWDLKTKHFRTIEDFRKTISELHKVDKCSDAFRYPLDTKGNASLSAHFRFNLFEFCDVLDSLFPLLEGAALGAYEELQQTCEVMAEARAYELDNADYEPYDDY